MRRRPDPGSLAGGIAVILLGLLLLLHQAGALELTIGYGMAAVAAAIGLALLASGLYERRR